VSRSTTEPTGSGGAGQAPLPAYGLAGKTHIPTSGEAAARWSELLGCFGIEQGAHRLE